MIEEMYVRGTEVNYYFVCRTKLWLFSRNVSMENESDLVKLGKLVHREYFKRGDKDVKIGSIAIDIVRDGEVIEVREVKKAKSMEKADFYQVVYYLYYLSRLGIRAKGKISYPKNRKVVEVELDDEIAGEIENVLQDIEEIKSGDMPNPEPKKYCRKCAYFEFCFA